MIGEEVWVLVEHHAHRLWRRDGRVVVGTLRCKMGPHSRYFWQVWPDEDAPFCGHCLKRSPRTALIRRSAGVPDETPEAAP